MQNDTVKIFNPAEEGSDISEVSTELLKEKRREIDYYTYWKLNGDSRG
jgi:hypothetical protein